MLQSALCMNGSLSLSGLQCGMRGYNDNDVKASLRASKSSAIVLPAGRPPSRARPVAPPSYIACEAADDDNAMPRNQFSRVAGRQHPAVPNSKNSCRDDRRTIVVHRDHARMACCLIKNV